MGRNFLGPDEWKKIGFEVNPVPPIPSCITSDFLESASPLHPSEKIKDTHVLVLIPQYVNGERYSLKKMLRLCESDQVVTRVDGHKVLSPPLFLAENPDEFFGFGWWLRGSSPSCPQPESTWRLLPKRDPDPNDVPKSKHFRDKTMDQQLEVASEHYPEYEEVRRREFETMVLLYELVNKEQLLSTCSLRCKEWWEGSKSRWHRVVSRGWLSVYEDYTSDLDTADNLGLALSRKLTS
jgi:hypothetical protein